MLALVGVAVVTLLAVTSTSGQVEYAARAPSLPWSLPAPDLGIDAGDADEATDGDEARDEDGSATAQLIAVTTMIAIVLFVAWQLVSSWRRRPRGLFDRQPPDDELEVLDDRLDALAAEIESDAAGQRALLLAGEPRNAIVRCWHRLEVLVERSGVERRSSDTSTDTTVRTLGALQIDADAIESLAALYREARFSEHEMDESQRLAAVRALDVVHAGLRRGTVAGAP